VGGVWGGFGGFSRRRNPPFAGVQIASAQIASMQIANVQMPGQRATERRVTPAANPPYGLGRA